MPWVGSVTAQREGFVALLGEGVTMVEACRRYGISRPTGYKWKGRFLEQGRESLSDLSRRPAVSPTRTSPEMESLVCEVRRRHPVWGGRKIRAFLLRQGHLGVPAASTITQILRRHGQLGPLEENRPVEFQRFEAPAPNLRWQIDFKGHFALTDGSRCHPLGILDDHSRYNLCLQACPDERTVTVKAHLEETFRSYGLPLSILADNGPPWGNTQPGFRWTPLTVWLLDLDIGVVHSRPRHPQTVGKQERFHLTLDLEVLTTQPAWETLTRVQGAFDQWQPIYNTQRPHQGIGLQVPADRYQPSPRPFPHTLPPLDYPPGWTVRTVDAAARITINHQRFKVGKPFIGRTVAISPDTGLIYYRTTPIRHV